ncbi:anti-sigma28 factor (negative regulator of flagellin synthesis) [Lachnospiraceae bacterium PF1-21]|uniref:Flagellar biosynthesis anti-sigma factor FlgM n=1 Tax=Ohessyouella blattaphilus TaxID=2949333 RepID=A0ABT1EH95_9FIRM|nr:flagellar biosynthesis anti-sigma factor FlgM [Ohessyouella blattaphilus]MCP1109152.1 flagellar biosynthesis anti-sigma factor FlgM [Ohessyouella blattaphilus]MCR8562546.1 flagellar biosynthesis anti-sigma factor FlgM [Ohessyouella blattaphilus]MDL2250254.1 flagellar biosynthesis anti-sigma factor FlgM [Lachnospiraceae bacterium OttesenSCG-928-J05]
MRISNDSFKHRCANSLSTDKKNVNEGMKMERSKQFDEVLLSKEKSTPDEKQIIEELTKKVRLETLKGTDSNKITSLKRQIAEGSYQIDIDEIAKRILLQGGMNKDE